MPKDRVQAVTGEAEYQNFQVCRHTRRLHGTVPQRR